MADNPQTLTAITNALGQKFPDRVARQINRMSVLLAVLPIVSGSGKNVAWDVEADGAVAENFSEGADVANYGSDALTPATLNWGQYRANFRVTHLAAAAAESSDSPGDARDLIKRNIENAVMKLASTVNAAGYSGAGTGTTIAGLDGLAIDDSSEYAGINRASASYWRSTVVDASGAELTQAHLRSDLASIYEASGLSADVALCNPAMFNKVKALFDANIRWGREVTTSRGMFALDNSPEVVVVDGCQFIRDKDCPSGKILYLNSNELEIEVLPQAKGFGSKLAEMFASQIGDPGVAKLLSALYAYEVARTGSSRKISIEAFLQLKVRRPNACGKRINIG